jgi:hypothetical protein
MISFASKVRILIALSAGSLLLNAIPVWAFGPSTPGDHMDCYKVKRENVASNQYTVNLQFESPPFADDNGCLIKARPIMACNTTYKVGAAPNPPPGGGPSFASQPNSLLCYKAKCPTKVVPGTVKLSDQFGAHTLTYTKHKLLCAPACAPSGEACFFNGNCCSGTCGSGICS